MWQREGIAPVLVGFLVLIMLRGIVRFYRHVMSAGDVETTMMIVFATER